MQIVYCGCGYHDDPFLCAYLGNTKQAMVGYEHRVDWIGELAGPVFSVNRIVISLKVKDALCCWLGWWGADDSDLGRVNAFSRAKVDFY